MAERRKAADLTLGEPPVRPPIDERPQLAAVVA
jgi:hypothetical protein